MNNPETSLPPGFRFHPTDEELILHYLRNKGTSMLYPVSIIAEVDIYKFDPWELPDKAAFGEKEWYFFSPRDRKYPNGARPNRAAASGYWKATGTDKPIVASIGGQENIGVKKALVFYKGRPPKGIKTNWIMHEYRLTETPNYKPTKLKDSSMRLDDFVLCRIYKKPNSLPTMTTIDKEQENSSIPDVLFNNQNTLKSRKSSSFSNLFDAMDYSILTRFLSDNPTNPTSLEHGDVVSYNNPDQPIFNNCTKTNNNNNNNNSSSNNNCSNYMFQNFPQMDSSVSMLENHLKRQHSMEGITDENVLHPSKRLNNLGSFTNNPYESDSPQYHLLNQTFYNQQLLLSSHLQFQR